MQEEPTDVSIIQLTQKERPADRFLASNVHELSHGRKIISFLSVVEIVDAWNPARELGVSIPQTFVRLFSNSDHQSVLTKFEDSLKGINKLLGEARIKSASPINCVLALVAGDEVYLASVGEVGLLLLRNGRLSHLSADTKDGSNEFTTVTSGELTSEDWLFVTNQNLGHLIEDLPIGEISLNASSSRQLETFLEEQIGLEDRRILAGCVVRFTPEAGELSTIFLDEVESRTPISLPKFSTPRLKLPKISLPALGPMFARTRELARRLTLRQWLLVGISLVIIIALIIGVTRLGAGKNIPAAPTQTLVSEMVGLSESEVRSFANTKITPTAFNALSSADQTLLLNMLTVSKLSLSVLPKELSTLPNAVVAIDSPAGITNELYLIDTTGQLWKWQSQLLSKIEQKQLIIGPVSLAVLGATKIVVSDQVGNIWLFDGSTNQPQSLTLPTKLATGSKLLQKYKQNLYLYSLSDNQIYRVSNFDKDLNNAAVTTKTALISNAPASDWAINGDIFTINATGKLLNLRRNVPVTTNPVLPGLAGPFHLAATETMMAKTDGRLIDLLDIASNQLAERIILTDEPITDIAANSSQGWWLVIKDKLYLLP